MWEDLEENPGIFRPNQQPQTFDKSFFCILSPEDFVSRNVNKLANSDPPTTENNKN